MMTGSNPVSLRAVGDSALLVEFDNRIAEDTHQEVLSLAFSLEQAGLPAIREVVSGYRTLLVQYDPLVTGYEDLASSLSRLAHQPDRSHQAPRHWEIPVRYGGEAAIDLKRVAERGGLSESEVIEIHSQTVYRVYMVGFAPGWTFLGGLDQRLFTPRLETPRMEVPAGCISIGGQQTLVGGPSMPSGWNLIGRTPERTFAPEREPAFFLSAGDRVSFRAIDRQEFEDLASRVEEGQRVSRELNDGR
jgi:KipI family sensor histidine kinase inhibitor